MTIWFTADTHLGHRYVHNLRGTTDQHIIDTINQHVQPTDTLYHLGDFALATRNQATRYRQAINAHTIHLVQGNHDNEKTLKHLFDTITLAAKIGTFKKDGWSVIASHCPWADWDKSEHGRIHLHGHIHSTPPSQGQPLETLPAWPARTHGLAGYNEANRRLGIRRLDVGWDAWGRPVHIDEILDYLQQE